MLVFSSAKLVFLSVPKTGSTAFEQALSPLASMVVSAPPELKHSPVFRYNRFFRPALEKFIGENIDVMAVMREPLDWLGSWYRYRQRDSLRGQRTSTHGVSFDEFVQSYLKGDRPAYANVGSQAKFLEPQKNGTAVTHLFRYEKLEDVTRFLEDRLSTKIEITQANPSPRMSLEISGNTRKKLHRKCADDFLLWSSIGKDGAYTPLRLSPDHPSYVTPNAH